MGVKQELLMDTTTIEHLACLEINTLILQPPFHLHSNVQWNDKGISFDGDIEVYNDYQKKKANFIGKVPIQIKGTTTFKRVHKKGKIKHSVDKKDLEVYYNNNCGVLYFVVTINPTTYQRQAYYRILAPLDLKSLLSTLDKNKKESITIPFKRMEANNLESVCKTLINAVERQPKHYIEALTEPEFTHYKISFVDIKKETFDFFEEPAYVYGVLEDIEMPLEVAHITEISKFDNETICLNDEKIHINYHAVETVEKRIVVIEETLTFELDKTKNTCAVHLGKLKTLASYVKCLQLIDYLLKHNQLPFQSIQLNAKLNQKENFQNIENDIKLYIELIDICNQIGINENYVFNAEEDLLFLFNAIFDIFKNRNYDSLNLPEHEKLQTFKIYNIEISKYVKLKLIYIDDKLINFYSEEVLTKIGGLLPKAGIDNKFEKDTWVPENWNEYYQKISVYLSQDIEEMVEDTNFDFDILKASFSDKYHDIGAGDGLTINVSLNFMKYYDKYNDEKYLELALYLNQRYLVKFPKSDIAKVNIYLIKLKQRRVLSSEEQDDILNIQERAENNKDQKLRFACEILLQNKLKANRLFDSLRDEEKETIQDYPIYNFYENMD
ncbi:DUF4365 domain-containing protein [Bacillus bombysepticus]|uniref:DUF4365 domain-containing protein n=1 Tax=Bacillus cereus TaxID=1396 RepID=UPI000BF9135D|nr:DUF4365 domain-containing protein [Bacillus cereus]PEU54101.1 DUF4365 domain-containing protein [Bacillus cereus]